ncbi:MAG: phosphohistidine phosphatase SixA [Planctomycetota bacterium]|nr:MAG: phosphohistidine phosphatase SixA [Planctomycetota bacterium]
MRLALLRHGRAEDREMWIGRDLLRPLTTDGANRCRRLCTSYRRFCEVDQIWSSPATRARQTANIAAEVWRVPVREFPCLGPDPIDPGEIIDELVPLGARSPLIVGHEPNLSELADHLGGGCLVLRKGGLAMLDGELHAHGMRLHALLAPRHLFSALAVSSPGPLR